MYSVVSLFLAYTAPFYDLIIFIIKVHQIYVMCKNISVIYTVNLITHRVMNYPTNI